MLTIQLRQVYSLIKYQYVVGLLYDEDVIKGLASPTDPPLINVSAVLGLLPGYKEIFQLVGL